MQFDDFLDAHPKVQADLKAKPQLANDRDYLKAHPELLDFRKTHPYVSHALHDNPGEVMHGEHNRHPHG
jgi:hypothetical protein